MTNAQNYVEALETEREGYERRGDDARVAVVDKQLAVWRKKAAAEKRAEAERADELLDDYGDDPESGSFRLPGADPNAQRVTNPIDPPALSVQELAEALRDDVLPELLRPLEERIAKLEELATTSFAPDTTPAPTETPKDGDVFTLPDDQAKSTDNATDAAQARKVATTSDTAGAEPADAPKGATPAKTPRQNR